MTLQKFAYKISKDLLTALIIIYFFLLIPELILPGIVSSHFSPKYFLLLLIAVALLHSWLGRHNSAPAENNRFRAISQNLTSTVLVVSGVMLVLSLYKMKLWQIAVVTVFSLALFVTAENMLVKEED